MPLTIPESHIDLFEKPIPVVATTIMPDGQPQSTVVWANYDGEFVKLNTAVGRQKDKNLRRDNRITLAIIDPEDPYRWIEVRGKAVEITEEGAKDHIHELARMYTGQPGYYGHFAPAEREHQEIRLLIKVMPLRVTAYPVKR